MVRTVEPKQAARIDRYDPQELLRLHHQMVLIRRFEETVNEMYTRAKIGGYCHLNIGEEGAIVGSISALEQRDYQGVEVYTRKCIALYEAEARKQQARLSDFAPKEEATNYWALNDVGTAYFVLGQALTAQGRTAEAAQAHQTVIEQFEFAQAWDPQGWFWKVAVASRGELNKLRARGSP